MEQTTQTEPNDKFAIKTVRLICPRGEEHLFMFTGEDSVEEMWVMLTGFFGVPSEGNQRRPYFQLYTITDKRLTIVSPKALLGNNDLGEVHIRFVTTPPVSRVEDFDYLRLLVSGPVKTRFALKRYAHNTSKLNRLFTPLGAKDKVRDSKATLKVRIAWRRAQLQKLPGNKVILRWTVRVDWGVTLPEGPSIDPKIFTWYNSNLKVTIIPNNVRGGRINYASCEPKNEISKITVCDTTSLSFGATGGGGMGGPSIGSLVGLSRDHSTTSVVENYNCTPNPKPQEGTNERFEFQVEPTCYTNKLGRVKPLVWTDSRSIHIGSLPKETRDTLCKEFEVSYEIIPDNEDEDMCISFDTEASATVQHSGFRRNSIKTRRQIHRWIMGDEQNHGEYAPVEYTEAYKPAIGSNRSFPVICLKQKRETHLQLNTFKMALWEYTPDDFDAAGEATN